jgi:hypothetical protein
MHVLDRQTSILKPPNGALRKYRCLSSPMVARSIDSHRTAKHDAGIFIKTDRFAQAICDHRLRFLASLYKRLIALCGKRDGRSSQVEHGAADAIEVAAGDTTVGSIPHCADWTTSDDWSLICTVYNLLKLALRRFCGRGGNLRCLPGIWGHKGVAQRTASSIRPIVPIDSHGRFASQNTG